MSKFTRRSALKALVASGITLSHWQLLVSNALASPEVLERFNFGIASGDPTHTSTVIWTRVTPISKDAKEVKVNWVLTTDPEFKQVIQSGEVSAVRTSDFTVKVNVKALKPGKTYYYKFMALGVESEPGRTKTLPLGELSQLGLAVVSCSNFPFGYFNAYDAIAKDKDIDFVLHLGDYIYEYGHAGYGGNTGKELGREHNPKHEIITLEDYRLRHAQYKSDLASRRMHATHPIITTWDDHESTNNPYMHGAQNHQDNEGSWEKRKNVSIQAYYEWMPIRDSKDNKEKLWRHFEFGNLALMVTLETRHTGRSKQIDYKDHLEKLKDETSRDKFLNDILGDTQRTMLSQEMTDFLEESLKTAVKNKTAWQVIGNQIPIAKTHVPNIPQSLIDSLTLDPQNPVLEDVKNLQKLGQLHLPLYLDTWDGYPAARDAFYSSALKAGVSDLLVLTGDSHSFWLNALFNSDKKKMGYEIGTAGVSSPGDFEAFGQDNAKWMDERLAAENQEVLWTNGTERGFVKIIFTHSRVRIDYMATSTVRSPSYDLKSIKSIEIEKSKSELLLAES